MDAEPSTFKASDYSVPRVDLLLIECTYPLLSSDHCLVIVCLKELSLDCYFVTSVYRMCIPFHYCCFEFILSVHLIGCYCVVGVVQKNT